MGLIVLGAVIGVALMFILAKVCDIIIAAKNLEDIRDS